MNLRSRILSLLTKRSSKSKIAESKTNRRRTQRALFMEGLEQRSLLAAFTPGTIAVEVIGDGSTALSGNAFPVFVLEYDATTASQAAPIQEIALPTTASGSNNILTDSGSATSNGMLNRSENGEYLVLPGRANTVGTSGAASTGNPIVGRIGVDGTADTSTVVTGAFVGNNFRSVTSTNGTDIWVAGHSGGTTGGAWYISFGSSTPVQLTTGNTRNILATNGQLYLSTGSSISPNSVGILQVGAGQPTSGTQTYSQFVASTGGTGTASPYDYAISPDGLTIYLADDRTIANGGGLQKYTRPDTSSAFTLATTFGTGAGSTVGARSIAVDFSGTDPLILITTAESSANRILRFTDVGGTQTGLTVLSTAPTNRIFRGVDFSPQSSSPAEVDVKGNNVSIADGDNTPDSADHTLFPDTTVSGSPSTRTYTILNTGSTPLTLSAPNSTDSAFVISGFPAGPIAGGGSATFDVVFTPTSVATFTSTISFTNSDSDEASYDFVVSGEGVSVPVNQPPVFDATGPYSLPENSPAATEVGTVTATDPDAGQTLTFSEIGTGTGAGLFEIDANGIITVSVGALLDFETTTSYTYGVRVTDNGSPNQQADVTVTINLSNVNEAPVFPVGAITRTLVQNSANGTAVAGGAVTATDPDAGGSVASYAITGGNGTGAGAFAISSTGVITVNDAAQVTSVGSFVLEVTATDNLGLVSAAKNVTVNVTGNNAPVFSPDVYTVNSFAENSANDTNVGGAVTATDPDVGNTITYSIVSGNGFGAGAFKINPTTGQVQVNDSTQMNFEQQASFVLGLRATDQFGAFDTATFTVNFSNTPDGPYIQPNQSFTKAENSANGTSVGTVTATWDTTPTVGSRRFEITAGNVSGAVAIDNNGLITVANSAAFDYEAFVNHQIVLTVRAWDSAFPTNPLFSDSETVVINLTNVHEGTLLTPGDIQVTGINADNDDEVTFMTMVDLAPGTEIRFTDRGWLAAGGLRNTDPVSGNVVEGVIVYVAPAGGLPAGSEIGFKKAGSTVSMTNGLGSVFDETGGTNFGLNTDGDSIIVFQGIETSPTPIYAATTYHDMFDVDATNSSATALPTGLMVGTSAVAVGFAGVGNETDNAEYTGPQLGSFAVLQAAISDSANWTKSNTRIAFTYQDFIFNTAPTDIVPSSTSIPERSPVGTAVGTLSATDADAGDSFTYELVAGAGSTDNASFVIVGNVLQANQVFNFEVTNSFSIRIRATDAGGLFVEKPFTISVTDVNEGPTQLTLSDNSIEENRPIGTVVGTFFTADPDVGDTHTYTFITGTGSTDNSRFSISGNQLLANEVFDYETQNSYSIRVRTTDSGGLVRNAIFTINVVDTGEAPTDISLTNASIDENNNVGDNIGSLNTTDSNPLDTFTYTLVTGAGDADNANFTIDGDTLKAAASFNFEAKSTYSVRIRSTDAGDEFTEKEFTISVNDVNEAPTGISLSSEKIVEDAPVGSAVGSIITADEDAGDNFTYTLVTGIGDTDNALFSIDGDVLRTAATFDFPASYSVRVRSTDSEGLFTEQALTISISDVKIIVPAVSTTVTFKEGAAPALIGSVFSVADVELLNFDGGSLTVWMSGNGTADDRLSIKSTPAANGKVTVDYNAGTISYTATGLGTYPVANFAGGFGGVPLVISFNANAFRTEVQAVLKQITYQDLNDNPSLALREASFVITDGDGGVSNVATRTITVTPSNDKPVVTASGSLVGYTENGVPVIIDPSITVTDVDSADFNTGKLTVRSAVGSSSTDRFGIQASGLISTSGNTVSYAGTPIGTFAGTSTLTVTLNSVATPAIVQELARHIVFSSVSDAPTTTPRQISFTVSDGDKGTSLAALGDIVNITPVNDAPVLTLSNATPAKYLENAVPVLISSGATVVDVDLLPFDTGTLTIALTGYGELTDSLSIKHTPPANAKVSVDYTLGKIFYTNTALPIPTYEVATFVGGDGVNPLVITFNNAALKTEVQAVMKAITFASSSDNPSTLQRTVSFTLTDGDGGTSNTVIRSIDVIARNDAPGIGNFGSDVNYSGTPVNITNSATVSDIDSANFNLGKLTVSLGTGKNSLDRVEIDGSGAEITVSGTTVSYLGNEIGSFLATATTSLVITFSTDFATPDAVQALLRQLTFRTTAAGARAVTVTASVADGDGGTSAVVSKSINVT